MSPEILNDILRSGPLIFDGAMGTALQMQGLTPHDFGREDFFGCNEYLVISSPESVQKVHRSYLEVGCDVIETNSFGATPVVLAEFGLDQKTYELNFQAARLAREVVRDFHALGRPRFVGGSMGPTTKLPSLGHITFEEMVEGYYIQSKGLVEGGVDLLCVETCQDILQMKAALVGINRYRKEVARKIPVAVSVTIETTGTMLLGTEVSAALTAVEPYGVNLFGLNCATGPREMSEHLRVLSASSPIPILVMPNAGIPENRGGTTHYPLTPDELAEYLSHYVRDLGVQAVGGCCGTTPEHLHKVVSAVRGCSPKPRQPEFVPSASSLYQSVPLRIDRPPVLIGERTNANGSKAFRDLLVKEDWEGIVAIGRDQVREQAHLQDVCVAYVGRDEIRDMREVVTRFNRQITTPLLIDSTDPAVIEEALKRHGGRAVVNSINLEDGEDRASAILDLCKTYGAAVIALTIDEQGMAKTAGEKMRIAQRLHDLVVGKHGLRPQDLILDPLTFTLASGDEEFRSAGKETLEAITQIKARFPRVHTLLGVSNISFGLQPFTRQVLNSVFLHHAVEAGFDMAIVHASKIVPLYRIDEQGREISRKLIFDERRYEGEGADRRVVYDPLAELLSHYSGRKAKSTQKKIVAGETPEERLRNRIVEGVKSGLHDDLRLALESRPALEIINEILLEGMKIVGDLFGSGQMQLPFVLQSAEVMKEAVSFLEPHMEKAEGRSRGTLVLATVKGDVHDIGKNLVDIILTNNGYRVINLGIRCPVESMIHAAQEERADAIGMSGLLVKSTVVMKENLEVLNERNLHIPVVLGGAALTRRYVEEDLRSVYRGHVAYAGDAFDGLRFMESIVGRTPSIPASASHEHRKESFLSGTEAKVGMSQPQVRKSGPTRGPVGEWSATIPESKHEALPHDHPVQKPPFWGSKVVESVSLDEVFSFVNEIALIRGQWRVVRGKRSEQEYDVILREQIYPELRELKRKVKEEELLDPKLVYGYFPCQAAGEELVIYRPPDEGAGSSGLSEWMRFRFPRQKKSPFRCISDFFKPIESGETDVVAFHLVTMGSVASEHSKRLFESDRYKDYLYFHGLSVESAEALAEFWHRRIREELGINGSDAKEIRQLFAQKYQGARYSFGYPACPSLEDQEKIFELLRPERIGVRLTEGFQLVPEQSTSAIIVHHPQAKYFTIN